jgi:hypothetical protein
MTVTNTSDLPRIFYADDQVLLREPPRSTGEVPKGGFGCGRCDGEGKNVNINPGDTVETVGCSTSKVKTRPSLRWSYTTPEVPWESRSFREEPM